MVEISTTGEEWKWNGARQSHTARSHVRTFLASAGNLIAHLPAASWMRAHDVILEVTRAVRFGPQADLAVNRRTEHGIIRRKQVWIRRAFFSRHRFGAECVLNRRRPVEPGFQAVAGHS